jgi:hypothetical protein
MYPEALGGRHIDTPLAAALAPAVSLADQAVQGIRIVPNASKMHAAQQLWWALGGTMCWS